MKTYIKSLLAIATVALLGSSAWAASTYSLSMYTGSEKSIALESDDTSSRTIGSVKYSYTDGSSGCIDETKTSANFEGKTMPKSSGTAASFTVVAGQKAGTVTLQIRRDNSSKTILCNLTVTVVAPVEKTVEDGKTITLDTGVDLGGRYYYKLVADTANYLTLNPANAKRESSGNSTGDLKVTGDRVTTSPVLVRLQTNGSTSSSGGTYNDVKVYSVTVKAKEPDPVKFVLFKDQKITFKDGAVTNWVDGELVLKFKADDEMTLPAKATADILVVGGGGAGVRGKSSTRNKYNGNGGNGGSATPATDCPMPAGSYNITVGNGAGRVTSGDYDFEGGEDGGDSSIVAGTGVTDFSPLTADGGAAWPSGDENSSGTKDTGGTQADSGKTGAELPSNIDGEPSYVYGKKGIPPPSSEVANQFDGKDADEYGEGGQGSANGGNSGAGYQGIVIVRLKDITPAKDQDEAISLSVGGAAKTFTTIATAATWTYDISEGGDEVVSVDTDDDNGHLKVTIAGIGDGEATIRFFADGQLIKTVTATVTSIKTISSLDDLTEEDLKPAIRSGESLQFKTVGTGWSVSGSGSYVTIAQSGDMITISVVATYGYTGYIMGGSNGDPTQKVTITKGGSSKKVTVTTLPALEKIELNLASKTTGTGRISYTGARYFARITGSVPANSHAEAYRNYFFGTANEVTDVIIPPDEITSGDVTITAKKIGTETITVARGKSAEKAASTGTDSEGCPVITFEVTVRDTPQVDVAPTAKDIKLGQKLSASEISGKMKDSAGNEVKGVWAWVDDSVEPGVGTRSYPAKFTPTGTNAQYYDEYERNVQVTVVNPLMPVAVPTAVTGLVYDYTEQTGVEPGEGYTLEGNKETDAGKYTAVAELDNGYCWADDSSTTNKFIPWEIGFRPVTVTAVSTNKLVGTTDPEFTTKAEGFIADDPSVLEWKVWAKRTNDAETVGFYDLIAYGDARQGSYDITYVDVVNGFEIRAGKVTVNGKGYDDVGDAIFALKATGGTARFNKEVTYGDYKFSNGAVLVYDKATKKLAVTGDMTVPLVRSSEDFAVNGTLTLNGDLYADILESAAKVVATNVVLGANVTVGETVEVETDAIAVLAFAEIDVGDYKLTLTTNGVVQSAKALDIDAIFTEAPEFFQITETQIDGGFEYKLEALNVVEVPTAVEDLVYNGNEQTGVVENVGFTLEGNTATDAGDYTATATLAAGYIWADGSSDPTNINWSISYAQATVTADNAEKTEGEQDPTFKATVTGTIGTDELVYTVARTNTSDEVGTYDIIASGEARQGNYDVSYVKGTFTINKKPTITITVAKGEGIKDVQTNGVNVVGALELPAGTTTVKLELVKDGLTIPVYKVITNDVTNVTQRVATYAVVEGLTYTFIAEEAEDDDPTVTPTDTKKAIIDAIDEENKAVVAPKIDAVVDTNEPPAAGKVSAKDMATWITEKEIQSVDMKDSNYLAASVNLDTSAPITDEAEVKFVEVEEDTSTGFTFDFELKLSGKETPEELEVEAKKLAGYIQTTGDLDTDFEVIGDTKRVTIDSDTGKVTITPDPTKSAEFFKIVIPKDSGVK